MRQQVSLSWEEWEDKFKPIQNNVVENASFNGLMFETYGIEDEFVRTFADQRRVWTYTDVDMGSATYNGYHWVNRIGYFITELPYEDDVDYEVDLQRNLCDNCEEPFSEDFEHEDGLCDKCCKGCEMCED